MKAMVTYAAMALTLAACGYEEDVAQSNDYISVACAGLPMAADGAGWVGIKNGALVDISGSGFPIDIPLLIPSGARVRGVYGIVSTPYGHDRYHRPMFSVNNDDTLGHIDTMGSVADDSGSDEGTVHQFGIRFDGFQPADVTAGYVTAQFYGEVGVPGTTIYGWMCDYEQ